MKRYGLVISIVVMILISSCDQTYPTFAPIENIRLGMTEEAVLEQIKLYKKNNVIKNEDEEIYDDTIIIDGKEVKIAFRFCNSIYGESVLEGVFLGAEEIEDLYERLREKKSVLKLLFVNYEKHIINQSFGHKDTLICLYTNNIEYEESRGAIGCKNLD